MCPGVSSRRSPAESWRWHSHGIRFANAPECLYEAVSLLVGGQTQKLLLLCRRNNVDDFTLAKNGFQVWTLPEMPEYTKDDQAIEDNQYPEITETLKKL
jgi:hypothetical protein